MLTGSSSDLSSSCEILTTVFFFSPCVLITLKTNYSVMLKHYFGYVKSKDKFAIPTAGEHLWPPD